MAKNKTLIFTLTPDTVSYADRLKGIVPVRHYDEQNDYNAVKMSVTHNEGAVWFSVSPIYQHAWGYSCSVEDMGNTFKVCDMPRYNAAKFEQIWLSRVKPLCDRIASLVICYGWEVSDEVKNWLRMLERHEWQCACQANMDAEIDECIYNLIGTSTEGAEAPADAPTDAGADAPTATETPTPEPETPNNNTEMKKVIIASTKDCTEMESIASIVQAAISAAKTAVLNTSDAAAIQLVKMSEEYPNLTPSANGEDNPDPQVFASWSEQQEVKMVAIPSYLPTAAANVAKDEGFDSRMVEALRDKLVPITPDFVLIRVVNEDETWFEYAF